MLWLALRHGSVIISKMFERMAKGLWLALRHGSVIIAFGKSFWVFQLWLALRHGSVIIAAAGLAKVVACTQARISYNSRR